MTRRMVIGFGPNVHDKAIKAYVSQISMSRVRHQLALRSESTADIPDMKLRCLLAVHLQNEMDDGWILIPGRHILLKPVDDNAVIMEQAQSVIGHTLGSIVRHDDCRLEYEFGLSGVDELPILMKPDTNFAHDNVHDFLGVDASIIAILSLHRFNNVGPVVDHARAYYCRPSGGKAYTVVGVMLEGMVSVGLIYCQFGREQQGMELVLKGDASLVPRSQCGWKDYRAVMPDGSIRST